MSVLDEVNKHRTEISTDTYTTTWRELVSQFRDGDLIINPDYQRLFRWDIDLQTQYIESVLLAIPSPPVFLARNADGKSEVIDGLQRISTVLKFFAGDLQEGENGADEEQDELGQNDITRPTRLTAGRLVPSLSGHTAATLPETLVRTVRYARITVMLLEKESSPKARYEVFRRLNKLGSQLSDQEIRNCTARLLGKEFPDRLRSLAEKKVVRDVLALSDEAERRMGVEEALLRLLAVYYSDKQLKHQVREFLDDFMEFAAEGKFKLTDDVATRVIKSFEMIHAAIPDGKAFKLGNQGFSTNLFEVVGVGVYHNVDTLTEESLAAKFDALLAGPDLKPLIGSGSNTRKKMQGRVALGKHAFSG